mgnify:CR=1 FL=1
MEISKELLSEVLGEDVRLGVYTTVESDEDELVQHIMKIEIYGNRVSYWRYYKECGDGRTMCKSNINIYELAFKLKEWAFSEGYQLEISRYWNIPTYYCKIVMRGGDFCEECGESRAIYELEDLREIDIVVKACEYILKEINGSK